MLYRIAASVLDDIFMKKGTAKSLIMGSPNIKNKKQVYALVCETLKYKSILVQLLQDVELQDADPVSSILLVVAYDATFGKGIVGRGRVQDLIRTNQQYLKSALMKMKTQRNIEKNEDLLPPEYKIIASFPRYARVNTLKTTLKDVVSHLLEERKFEEFVHFDNSKLSWMEFVSSVRGGSFTADIHVDNLLLFPPGSNFHDHVLYKNGSLILQDKASCIPAQVLMPEPGSVVIDACAAPGNKSTHLASLMANNGVIYAFDLDRRRLSTLKKNVDKCSASCVNAVHKDFLTVSPSDVMYSNVEYILVDPSCSGSGMIDRFGSATDDDFSTSQERISALAKFQLSALTHALSFPRVKRVVYSTCSVHTTENEDVVSDALKEYSTLFQLVDIMSGWKNRGSSGGAVDKHVVRCDPKSDLTNGFFVACFERISPPVPTLDITGKREETGKKRKCVEQKSGRTSKSGKSHTNGKKILSDKSVDNVSEIDKSRCKAASSKSIIINSKINRRKRRRGRGLKPITDK